MNHYEEVLNQLIGLSRSLGDPDRDLVILGEGNTSAKVDEEIFLVKASGEELGTANEKSFVAVSLPLVLEAFNLESADDETVHSVLVEAKIHQAGTALPSMETFLHAYLLSLPGIRFVAHTHPAPINAILCSVHSREAVRGRLFPDEIVCCGPAVCYVEYADPGIPVGRQLRRRVEEFIDEHNMPPKVVLMENHGFIACGLAPRDIQTITSMYVKVARVLLGTFSLGGPRFLSRENVYRIHTRPDEHYRQERLAWKGRAKAEGKERA